MSNASKSETFIIIGMDELEGEIFAICTSRESKDNAMKLLSEECGIADRLMYVPIQFDTVIIDGEEIITSENKQKGKE